MLLSKLDDGQGPKKKTVSFNFNHALFSLLYFLILEDGTDRLSQTIGKELHLCCEIYQKSTDLT